MNTECFFNRCSGCVFFTAVYSATSLHGYCSRFDFFLSVLASETCFLQHQKLGAPEFGRVFFWMRGVVAVGGGGGSDL